jgi:hypothetical protein
MNRCAVGEMETGGHLDGPDGLTRCHRPHGHHQGCGKRAGWGAAFVGSQYDPYSSNDLVFSDNQVR